MRNSWVGLIGVLFAGIAVAQEPVILPATGPVLSSELIPNLPSPTTALTADAKPAEKNQSFDVVWNNGLFIQTKDKDFVVHLGATVHYDAAFYTASPGLENFAGGTGKFNDGVNLRRARIRTEGTMYKNIDFMLELEFMNGVSPAGLTGPVSASTVSNSPGPTDAWITIKSVPVLGNVRIGSQKEPIGLEHLNSYRNLEFMERSYLFDAGQATAFNNGFSPGISTFRTWADDRVYTAIGVFKNESDLIGFGLGDGQYATTGRVAFLPIYCPDEKYFLHVGGAMSYRDPVGGQVRVRIRNDVRNAPFPLLNLIADTGAINASSQSLFALEAASSIGPVSFQAEYLANLIRNASVGTGPDVGTATFQGFYAETMLFLTGEHRSWNPKTATFNRVIPKANFGFDGDRWTPAGIGAWELAARYTYLNLTDKGINGGRLNSVTLGLNWYMNPNAKMQFNYDYLYRDNVTNTLAKGQVHSFGTRLAFDF